MTAQKADPSAERSKDPSGGITGAQASIYSRGKETLDQCLSLLDGLYALDSQAVAEEVAALKFLAKSQLSEVDAEMGYVGGPRISRVNQSFQLLLGSSYLTSASVIAKTDPDQIGGTLGRLRNELGLTFAKQGFVSSVQDEQDLTNYRIVSDYITSLSQSWLDNVNYFVLSTEMPFFGTQLVLLFRQLSVLAESVYEVRFALDSVFIGPAERQTIELDFGCGPTAPPQIFLEDLLSWIQNVATQEGPALIQDGANFDVSNTFYPVVQNRLTRSGETMRIYGGRGFQDRRFGCGAWFRRGRRWNFLHPTWVPPTPDPQVTWAQSCLAQSVDPSVPQDGLMGPQTQQAIRTFQMQQQLPPTGILDPNTMTALQAACRGQSAARQRLQQLPLSRRSKPLCPHLRATVRWVLDPLKETSRMNNLHRELAPISDAAWAQIEEETSRTFKRHLAGRRVVDLHGPAATSLAAVGTGHLLTISGPSDGMVARQREVKSLVELRVPFDLERQAIDDVERGANDSDWQPAKDAARKLAYAEDGAIFESYAAAGIVGIRQGTSNPAMTLPGDVREYPDAFAQGLSQLRLAGVNGPYAVLLDANFYTALAASSDQGYPVLEHVKRLFDDKIIWTPAIQGAFVVTTRGGDFDLHIGQDVSIGYLNHTDTTVSLYLQETLTFLILTSEAAIAMAPPVNSQKS